MVMKSRKPYKLELEKRPDYLYAHVRSDSNRPTIASQYLREITQKCRESQCTKLIIENDVPKAFWVWDIFSVAMQFPLMGIECTRVAVVDNYPSKIETVEFAVVVGANCGLNLHVFTNFSKAEDWLMHE